MSAFLDVTDPAFDFDAAEVADARAQDWYARSPVGLLVLRYPETRELLRDPRLDHDGAGFMRMRGITEGPIHDWFVPMIINRDGPEHRRLRSVINRAFTPRMISNLVPYIREHAAELAGSLAGPDGGDFVGGFATPLPLAVISRLLGVPAGDHAKFHAWTMDIGLVFSLAYGSDVVARVEAAVVGLHDYVDGLLAAKAANPADDLISALLHAQRADGQISHEELRNLIVTLVFAAYNSTRHQFTNAMLAFTEHPAQWRHLAARPELAGRAVEEVMRWCPSSPAIYRFAREDFTYGGLDIAKGTYLMLCVRVAQRDPAVFPGGDTFDITADRPAPVLQFSVGPHHCVGAALARAELSESFTVLSARFGPPSVAGRIVWRPPTGIYGPHRLPLRFAQLADDA